MDTAHKNTFVINSKIFSIVFHLLPLHAVANKYHPKILLSALQSRHGIQNQLDPFVPHQSPHKKINGNIRRNTQFRALLQTAFLRNPTFRKVHTVFHHNIVSLISEASHTFSSPLTHDPDFVAGGDIIHQKLHCGFSNQPISHRMIDLNIKFCVVSKYHGNIQLLP